MLFQKQKIEFVVAALGNPGKKYENTRHNAGFLCAAYLLRREGADIRRARFSALTAELTVSGKRILLLLPQTYMNLSGKSVAEAMRFYRLAPEQLIVISDDIHLPVGTMRIRKSGSAGGHNGLRNIIDALHSDAFSRIRIGVGEPPEPGQEQIDWVTGDFSGEDQKTLPAVFENACAALDLMVLGDVDTAMNRYNGGVKKAQSEKTEKE